MRSRFTPAVVVLAFAGLVSACGGGDDPTQPASSANAGGSATSSVAAPPAGAPNRCPLTAEQVSAAVGAPVTGPVEGICQFEPADRKSIRPTVLFVRQFGGACTGTVPAENGFKEQVQGLGTTAYIADESNGTRILVCQGRTPFEMVVDAETPQLRREAAVALARQVLAAS